jgi:hypothetical protein
MKLENIVGFVGRNFGKVAGLSTLLLFSPAYADEKVKDVQAVEDTSTEIVSPEKRRVRWRPVYLKPEKDKPYALGVEGGPRVFWDDSSVDAGSTVSVAGRLGYNVGAFGRLRLGFIDTLTSGKMPEVPSGDANMDDSLTQTDPFGNVGVLDVYRWNETMDYFNGFFGEVEGGYGLKVGDVNIHALGGIGVFRHHKDRRDWDAKKLTSTDAEGNVLDEDPVGIPLAGNQADANVLVPAVEVYAGVGVEYGGFSLDVNGGPMWDTDNGDLKKTLSAIFRYEF